VKSIVPLGHLAGRGVEALGLLVAVEEEQDVGAAGGGLAWPRRQAGVKFSSSTQSQASASSGV
jgi:hypothetical protein